MRRKRFNKRAEEDEAGHTLIGLVLLALILFAVGFIMFKYGKQIISFIGQGVKNGFLGLVNPGSLYTTASEANFYRLNDELSALLKNSKSTDYILVPYTIGQYRLVGFNKDPLNGINRDCLGDNLMKARSDKCKNSACLCICHIDEVCDCTAYPDVDYFFTVDGGFRNIGGKMDGITDPVTGKEVECLEIQGAANEKDIPKGAEPVDNWWGTKTVYLEKTEKGGKRYVLFSRYKDVFYTIRGEKGGCDTNKLNVDNCASVKSCQDYQTADLGCDWTYNCQNNVCTGAGLQCNVIDNPYAQSGADSQFCLEDADSLGILCSAGPADESAPSAGKSGDLFWVEARGICFRCKGLGQESADSWGWMQEPAISKANCAP